MNKGIPNGGITMRKKEIETISYECPFCDKEHSIQVLQYDASGLVKNVKVQYRKTVYYCEIEEEEFTPDFIMDKNLAAAREAYRKQNELLTVEEIKQIRDIYGLTQKEYSRLLGLGDVTIQRYETKAVQDDTYDMMMRLTRENPEYCLEMLEKNKKSFEMERYQTIRECIINRIKLIGENYFTEKAIQTKYAEYNQMTDENGYCLLDIKKVRNILGYLAEQMRHLYKVKAMKLLWYIDELSYRNYGKSMTGLVYRHKPYGALPVAHNELIHLQGLRVTEEEHEDYTAYRIEAAKPFGKELFTYEENVVLEKVINKFKNYSTREIVDYMHQETAYQKTADNEVIRFNKEYVIRNL